MSPLTTAALLAAATIPLLVWWVYAGMQAKSAAQTEQVRQAHMRARRAAELPPPPPAKAARVQFGRR